ncbi:MAG: glycosyltransferase [Prevotellaceae bacterium]|jgi:glycosyltransferase involved in cell wall biosynthesis|nr:glycosyltransferase [Prevotellaceae bacterium]
MNDFREIKSTELPENPLVSIIVCSHNRAEYIGQTLDSILAQQCNFDFEIVVGDDCSEEPTRTLLKQYQQNFPQKIRLVFQNENIGLAANWAVCVKLCKGKYIAQCDDDDFWHATNKLQIQADYLDQNPDCSTVYTNSLIVSTLTGNTAKYIIDDIKYTDKLINIIFYTQKFKAHASTFMYRTDDLLKYVPLDDYIKYRFTLQDWGTLCLLSAHTRLHYLPQITTTYRFDNYGITRPQSYEKLLVRMKKEKELYSFICEKLPEHCKYNEKRYDAYIDKVCMSFGYRANNYEIAHHHAKEILKSRYFIDKKAFFALTKWSFRLFVETKKIKYTLKAAYILSFYNIKKYCNFAEKF